MKKIKQFFCNHKNIEVKDVVTEKNKTIMLGECMRCGKEQITIIKVVLNEKKVRHNMKLL